MSLTTRYIVGTRTEHFGGVWEIELTIETVPGDPPRVEIRNPSIGLRTYDATTAARLSPGQVVGIRIETLDEHGNPWGAIG